MKKEEEEEKILKKMWTMDRNHNSNSRRQHHGIWKTCICIHVKTVAILIGIFYLMMYVLALSFIAAIFMYGDENNNNILLPLPTPLSNKNSDGNEIEENNEENPRNTMENLRHGPLNLLLDTTKANNSQVILLTICNFLITLLMVYGAVRGKPSYLMPFFVLKVFDFCIFCLTMVGYFSYLPNITDLIAKHPNLIYRDELMQIDPQLLSLFALFIVILMISLKAYVIGIIWNCYKYLMLKNSVISGVINYRNDNQILNNIQQNPLLPPPDLPDYETAINDPRYAKKPEMIYNTNITNYTTNTSNTIEIIQSSNNNSIQPLHPPPPYSVAIIESIN